MKMLLFLHVVGAVLLLGNIVTAAFWKVRAEQTGNPALIHHAVKNVMLADYVFTIPGLVLLIVSGGLMAERAGYDWAGFNWLTLSLLLFVLTGVLWLGVLLPLQRRLIRLSARAMESGKVDRTFRRLSRLWDGVGTVATLLPVAILYLMIAKGV
jgi:uncharacterized membrane protein